MTNELVVRGSVLIAAILIFLLMPIRFWIDYRNSEKRERQAVRMTCPKCGGAGSEVSNLTIKCDGSVNYHCSRCYARWIRGNVPRLEPLTADND